MTDNKNKPSRPKKTTEELHKSSDSLYYEVWMFNEMATSLLTQSPQPRNPQYNALVESFVQHTRILIEFFYPPDRTRYPAEKYIDRVVDTIIAPDYFVDESQWKECLPVWLRDVRDRAHKLLAHLSYSRVFKYENDKGWDYLKIIDHLNGLFVKFLKEVPQDRIIEELKKYKILALDDFVVAPNGQMIRDKSFRQTASTGVDTLPGATVFSTNLFPPCKS